MWSIPADQRGRTAGITKKIQLCQQWQHRNNKQDARAAVDQTMATATVRRKLRENNWRRGTVAATNQWRLHSAARHGTAAADRWGHLRRRRGSEPIWCFPVLEGKLYPEEQAPKSTDGPCKQSRTGCQKHHEDRDGWRGCWGCARARTRNFHPGPLFIWFSTKTASSER